LYQPFHILGFYSAFPADIINQVEIYAGGFGSQFGGRISSVIDVHTRLGNSRRFGAAVAASPFVSSLQLEGPISRDRASFLVSVRQSHLEEGASRFVDAPMPCALGDAIARLHYVTFHNGQA